MRTVAGIILCMFLACSDAVVSGEHEIRDLSFMSGCWAGPFGDGGTMEEIFTSPSENLILGTTRFLKDGAAVQFEFSRIQKTDGKIVLTPYPNGHASEHGFRLTSLAGEEAIFEAPQHDFPKRIIYRKRPEGGYTARIDGGEQDSSGREWVMKPAACPGAKGG